jgi:hypothetical protein
MPRLDQSITSGQAVTRTSTVLGGGVTGANRRRSSGKSTTALVGSNIVIPQSAATAMEISENVCDDKNPNNRT